MMWNGGQTKFVFSSIIKIVFLLLSIESANVAATSRSTSRHITILNNSGRTIEIYWIHPTTGEGVLMTTPSLTNGANFPLDSFVGHTFEARELPSKKTGTCGASSNDSSDPGVCRRTFFEVSSNDDQLTQINAEFEAIFVDDKIKAKMAASDLVGACQAEAQKILDDAEKDSEMALKAVSTLVECVQGGVASALEKANEEIAFQADVRKTIAATLENYTCVDDSLNSTSDLRVESWENLQVHIKHERPASKIHVVDNFIRDDECKAMEQSAASILHHAAVADGKGGSRLSENRKAMQAGIKVPWDKEKEDNPIARLSRRVYDYTNRVLNLNIDEFGQEDLMSIQYFGRGRNDTEPDRYTPHCDGDCTGLTHKEGTRMATMVMYCDVAESGGHTNFRNSGVHVKPEKNAAVFFSYIDPAALIMDTGFTEHSGCPVYEGTKRIVTQWIRLGVDNENPWTSFNTLGIKKSELDE